MANTSVSGLVSGLDTATLINQLMQVEGRRQTMLETRAGTEQTAVNALQTLNSKLAAIATKAQDLALTASWSPLTATSSSEHVTATAGDRAAPGSWAFTVQQTARSHQLSFTTTASLDARVTPDGSTLVRLDTLDGTTTTLDTGDGTLGGLMRALNATDTGVRATTVRLDDGSHRLRVESATTGAASDFTLTAEDGTPLLGGATVTSGRDAAISIGADTVHAATNTFSGVLAGVDVTLSPAAEIGSTVEITLDRDVESMTGSVKSLVDAANAVLADIASLTSYDPDPDKSGVLAGDATVRALRGQLLSAVTSGVDGSSLASVGVQIDRSGTIVFDPEKFEAAYVADPAGTSARFAGTADWSGTGQVEMVGATWRTAPGSYRVEATSLGGTIDGRPATVSGNTVRGATGSPVEGLAVTVNGTASGTLVYTQGFAAKLAAVAQRASDSELGTVTSALKGRTSAVDSINDAIAAWDVRLSLRRESLTRQYAALEVALGRLQNQSNWLAGQISSLPTGFSS